MHMGWIRIEDRFPKKDGKYYRCLCLRFGKPIKCRFVKGKNGPTEWYPSHFVHKKRIPYAVMWLEKE